MIRFPCPLCGKMLKVTEDKAGKPVVCPRCDERCVVPAESSTPVDEGSAEPARRFQAADLDEAPGLFWSMPGGLRWAVISVAAAGVLGLLLAVLSPLLFGGGATSHLALVTALCSFVLLCVILHGHGTGCPGCRKWWSRTRVSTEFVDREVFDKGGVPFARSVYKTTYACTDCGRRWSVTDTEEFKATDPTNPQRARKDRVERERTRLEGERGV
jgi:DNA-directed RNA polymerase subunit RPC12/RpoP